MKTYTTQVLAVDDEEAYFIDIPNELLDELGWKPGDIVEWNPNDDSSYSLRKL
jgi:bifunctional DNA-binding transcriptional regulator/antitoxin component of YhaV-PrlF toxin-antitoxin module